MPKFMPSPMNSLADSTINTTEAITADETVLYLAASGAATFPIGTTVRIDTEEMMVTASE
jgi:hypothetical protein